MSTKRLSRRRFLSSAGIPAAVSLSGLPLIPAEPEAARNTAPAAEAGPVSSAIEVESDVPSVRVKEAVLFPFDDRSIGFTWGLKLRLIMGKLPGQHSPIVVRAGGPGQPDNLRVRYYGTVIQIGDQLRMWYLGQGDKSSMKGGGELRPMYAVSNDGIHWEKPKLDLIEYEGNKENNLIDLMGGEYGLSEYVVIHDPEDPDPARRFKMAFESGRYQNRLAVAFSADGLTWRESSRNPVATFLEESGLIKYNGCYYVNGQGGGQYGSGRKMVSFASYDFEHWTQPTALSFRRGPIVELGQERWNDLEQVHLGASLMNRGNVVMGVYGMWHGIPTNDRAHLNMDLGLIVSNDGVSFREPIPDFPFVPGAEELEVPVGRGASIAQGQGMANIGDRTLYWYEAWGLGGVRVASWERDRFGYLSVFESDPLPHNSWNPPANLISCAMKLGNNGGRVSLNASGLSEKAELTVEVLDREFRSIPGFAAGDCIPVRASGFRHEVSWKGKESLPALPHAIRARVLFGGERPEDIKLYAVYVTSN